MVVKDLKHKDLAPGERNMTVVLVSVSGLFRIKKLLLIILLLAGCAREYCCYPEEIESIERGCGGFNYKVNWPDGEKEAEEQCEEELEGEVFMSPGQGITLLIQGCRCEKAD